MPLEIYPILIVLGVILLYFFGKKNENPIKKVKRVKNDWETFLKSDYNYIVIVRVKDKIYKTYEDNNLGKVGYYIYSEYGQIIDKLDVYIKDIKENKLMSIEKDKESESMFAVKHPEEGFIGYLSFEFVDKIK